MKREIVIVLHKPLSNLSGRNNKIKSRIKMLKDNGWDVKIFVFSPRNIFHISKYIVNNGYTILTMSNPIWLHLPGLILKYLKRDSICWMAEFRDMTNPYHKSYFLLPFILGDADKVVVVDGVDEPDFCFRHVEKLPYWGYDKKLFNSINPVSFDRYTFVYAGCFYKNIVEPYPFLNYLKEYIDTKKLNPSNIQALIFTDTWQDEYNRFLFKNNLISYVHVQPFLDYQILIGVLKGADQLIYIGSEQNNIIYSKFWEYLGSGSKIKCFGNTETIKEILKQDATVFSSDIHDTAFLNILENKMYDS